MLEIQTPEWVKHAVFYQIFPDRFAISPRVPKPNNLEPWDSDPTTFGYKGGDLLGVVERLDHIQALGVTAIYFCPIFQSASNHRYHTHDYYQVDPLLGGNAALDELLEAAHSRGMKVVLDGVFNHASRGFFQFNDILENGQHSPWLDWFTVHGWPLSPYDTEKAANYRAWVDLRALPAFNTDNPQVRAFIMGIAEHWLRKGIDGWRLDVPFEVKTPGFWQEFRQRVKAINPEAYIVGEVWTDSSEWLQGDQFDGVMNYLLTEALIAFCAGPRVVPEAIGDRSYHPFPPLSGHAFAERLDKLLALYPWPIQLTQLNLLDSHDTARFVTIANDDLASVRLAALLLFTLPGAPSIYYGDEIGLTGGLPDRWARKTMPWEQRERWNMELYAMYQALAALRHANPALRTGALTRLAASEHSYAFARSLDGRTLAVAVNVGETAETLELPVDGEPQLLYGRAEVARSDQGVRVALPAREGAVFELAQRSRSTS
jgi:glycosidase